VPDKRSVIAVSSPSNARSIVSPVTAPMHTFWRIAATLLIGVVLLFGIELYLRFYITAKVTEQASKLSKFTPAPIHTVGTSDTLTLPLDLSSAYNAIGIYNDGSKFPETGLDGVGFACSEQVLGSSQTVEGVRFRLGQAGAPDVVRSTTVTLPSGKFSSLKMLAMAINGSQNEVFTVSYADNSVSTLTQHLSDWYVPSHYEGESVGVIMPYRLRYDGRMDVRTKPFYIYAYSFNLDSTKQVQSISLPHNRNVVVFAITLVPAQAYGTVLSRLTGHKTSLLSGKTPIPTSPSTKQPKPSTRGCSS